MAELTIRAKPAATANAPSRNGTTPRIGLALGGGGARGLAHILILEALDELGIRPHVISGTSIGAIYGAACASGLPAKYIRAHTEEVLSQRVDLARHLYASRAEAASRWLNLVPIRPAILNAESLLEVLLPAKVARDFADLSIPLQIVATDFYAQEQRVFASGPLRRAVAASMALPAIFTPVTIDGRTLVDGGLVNPLPFDLIAAQSDITIAIDVSGAPTAGGKTSHPSAIEVMMAASQIFQRSIVREKLKAMQPDIFIECPVDVFTVLDFHRFKDILAAAAPVKDELKRKLNRVLSSHPMELLPAPPLQIEATPATQVKVGRGKKRLNQAKALIQRRRKKKNP